MNLHGSYNRRMSQLKQLLLIHTDYSAWATRQLLDACSPLTLDELKRDFGASHAGILRTFCHYYDGERIWLRQLIEADGQRLPSGSAPELPFETLVQSWPELWIACRQWLKAATEADLIQELETVLPGGTVLRSTRWQLLLHVVTHSTMHRGQIISMLRDLGMKPPDTDDLTYFLIASPNL